MFVYETLIRESHLDSFGHVNNAKYLELFEEARWELITQGGYGLKQVQERKQGPVILAVEVQFRKELSLRETIRIETSPLEMKTKIGKLKQTLYKSSGDVSAVATFTLGFFDLERRKLISPSSDWLAALSPRR